MNQGGRVSKFFASIACIFAAGLCLGASNVAKADDIAYMAANNEDFGTIDLNTGVFSMLGSTEVGNSLEPLSGMAEINGTLYGAAEGTNANGAIYTINPTNGALTVVGATGISIDDFGSSATGLYAVNSYGTLYSIDAATGAATAIGSKTISLGGYRTLSTNASSLYFANGNRLYTIDTTTGLPTLIGSFGMSGGISIQLGALLEEDGTLYGGAWAPGQAVDTIDTTSGAATVGSALTGTSGEFVGLAPYPVAVPAPLIGNGLPVGLAVGGVLFGARLLARGRKRRWFDTATPHAAA